jgi:hypothetical protein
MAKRHSFQDGVGFSPAKMAKRRSCQGAVDFSSPSPKAKTFCHSCQQYDQSWSDNWMALEAGSKYHPNKDGEQFTIFICPSCVKALTRDARRETRNMNPEDFRYYDHKFWLDEIAFCVRQAEIKWNEWNLAAYDYMSNSDSGDGMNTD